MGKTFRGETSIGVTLHPTTINLSDATATTNDVLEGKIAYNSEGKITGTYKDMLQQRIEGGVASYLFYECLQVVKTTDEPTPYDYKGVINISKLDTSNVKDMSYMFNNFKGNYIGVSMLDTSKVTNMNSMFRYPSSGTTVRGLKNFNTSNVTDMAYMFAGYISFNNLDDIANWDVRNVTKMSYMFNRHQNTILDLSNWDTSKVTTMVYMFDGCEKLQTVMGKLNLINVSSASSMFNGCKALTNLTLKNIKISLQIGSGTSYGENLSLDTLYNTIYELHNMSGTSSKTLTTSTASKTNLADKYIKLVDVTDPTLYVNKDKPFLQVASTDENAISIVDYASTDAYISNKVPFVVCESTDDGAMLITEYVTNVKNWTLA